MHLLSHREDGVSLEVVEGVGGAVIGDHRLSQRALKEDDIGDQDLFRGVLGAVDGGVDIALGVALYGGVFLKGLDFLGDIDAVTRATSHQHIVAAILCWDGDPPLDLGGLLGDVADDAAPILLGEG